MKRAYWLAALGLLACDPTPSPSREGGALPSSSSVKPVASQQDAGLAVVTMGPKGSSKTALQLLRGELPAKRFPLFATDDGSEVDLGLRAEVAPRIPGKAKVVVVETPDGVDEKAAKRVVERRLQRFVGCYQRGLTNNPNLQGHVVTALVLSKAGNVTDVKGAGDIPDASVFKCVAMRMRELQFPKPGQAGVTLRVRLEFEPALAAYR